MNGLRERAATGRGGGAATAAVSVWLPTAPCTPEDCVAVLGVPVGAVRRVVRGAGCAALLIVGVVLMPPVRCLAAGRRARAVRLSAARVWARLLLRSLGVRVRVTGAVPSDPGGAAAGRGTLLVANHVSWLDVLLLAAVRPGRMLAKAEVRRWPVLGPLAARGGTVFLDRDRLRALPGTVEEVAAALRRGERVVVFPEGSTWCGRGGGRFRPALFEAAVRAGADVEPVAIRYRTADGEPTTAAAFVGDDALLPSLGRVLASRGLVADLVLLPVIPAGRHRDRRDLAAGAQAAVRAGAAVPAGARTDRAAPPAPASAPVPAPRHTRHPVLPA